MTETKKKPFQIYLRADQVKALRAVAERRGESIAALIREGVDLLLEGLPTTEDPLLDLLALFDSGAGNLAEKHDQFQAELITRESSHEA